MKQAGWRPEGTSSGIIGTKETNSQYSQTRLRFRNRGRQVRRDHLKIHCDCKNNGEIQLMLLAALYPSKREFQGFFPR